MVGKIRPYLSHIITWLTLLVLPFIGYLYQPEKMGEFNAFFAKTHFINLCFLAIIFYLNLNNVAPRFFFGKNIKKYYLFLVSGIAFYILLSYLFYRLNPQPELKSSPDKNFIVFRIVIGPIFIYSLVILTSTLMFLYDEQARQKEVNKQIELEKTAAELNMLKLQISPHFLFNTLNNIRWLIRKKSEQSEESIMKLSEILRYIIYEVEGGKVDLIHEIEHLRNFIELQTLRLPVQGKVEFTVDQSLGHFRIEPMLFIHFVENAFKYGIDSKNAPEIAFELKMEAKELVFKSRNKILVRNSAIKNEGIGLANIQRRLQLLYPGRHSLSIDATEDYFEVILKLNPDEN